VSKKRLRREREKVGKRRKRRELDRVFDIFLPPLAISFVYVGNEIEFVNTK